MPIGTEEWRAGVGSKSYRCSLTGAFLRVSLCGLLATAFQHSYFSVFMRTHTRFQVETSIFCEFDISRKRQSQNVMLERQQYHTYYPSRSVMLRKVKNFAYCLCNRKSAN